MLSWLGFGALPLARSDPEMNEMLRRICRRNFCTCTPRPWLFVGLGNPGDKYRGTRHNVGFEMLDAFAVSQGIHMETVHCKAMFGKGLVNGIPVLLAKPLTYMNLSGESIGPLAAYYKLPLNRVIVFHDDMDLPCGVLRLHPKGGHNRHNGLKSVIYHFRGNGEFPRLRIGIGRPPGQMDPKAFMLQKFNLTARERVINIKILASSQKSTYQQEKTSMPKQSMLHYWKEHMHWSRSYPKASPKVLIASIQCRSTSTYDCRHCQHDIMLKGFWIFLLLCLL